MNRTLLALWAIIFGSVLAIVALVVVSNNQREAQARLDLAGLLRAQLFGYNRDIRQMFEQYDRQLQQAVEGFDPKSTGAILNLERHPLCGLVVVVSDDGFNGKLWHPDPAQVELVDRSLVEDAVTWLRDSNFAGRDRAGNSLSQAALPSPEQQPLQQQQQLQQFPSRQTPSKISKSAASRSALSQSAPPQAASPQFNSSQLGDQLASSSNAVAQNAGNQSQLPGPESQWTTWYHGRGLVLGFWTKSLHETVTMVIVPRGKWLADLIAVLPDNAESRSDALIQLIDVEGTTISQWGNLDLVGSSTVDAEMAVDDPLEGWRLRMLLTPAARAKAIGLGNRWLSIWAATGFSLALILLGALLTLNINRQLRLAQRQVSFVNQVSHELRTPLTNIRMYTDLTLHDLEAHRELGMESEIERLTVIQQESDRLGRLIENVLAFARSGKPRPMRPSLVESLESLIDDVLATFAPQLREHQMIAERRCEVAGPVRIDREAVEQILVNLISNAIKYAASGRLLRIETRMVGDKLELRVIDHGPGIPKRLRQRVFEPFVRGSNRLEDPAGTGIGLSIARQLARQHGGDCRLEPTATGCTFVVEVAIS